MKKLWLVLLLFVSLLGVSAIAQMGGSDEEIASSTWKLINDQDYTFTWHYEPGAPAGFYRGSPPHGKVLRTFYNNIAFDATQTKPGSFPIGSVLVKENHISGHNVGEGQQSTEGQQSGENERAVENFTPNLEAVTVMVKVPGYNPEAGDWFWVKYQPDGTVDEAGKAEGCIACHSKVADNDYVFDAQITSR